MWTPDVVFENQVSLEGDADAIKNESDAVVQIIILHCSEETEPSSCENPTKKKIRFSRTISLGVNCPDMQFDDFPFDTQNCDVILQDLKLTENTDFQWERAEVVQRKALTSNEYNLSLRNASANSSGFGVMLSRKSTVYIYTYFLPSGLMVMVSWISFAVKVDAVPGRWQSS